MEAILNIPSPIQELLLKELKEKQLQLFMKRDDLIHPYISGNKWRKLKYNMVEAKKQRCAGILTFGGAFSNHIAATAATGKIAGIKTIGIIRGDEFRELNPTLSFAKAQGMELQFISRADYAKKAEAEFLTKLAQQHDFPWIIPEGGANEYGVKGCEEILSEDTLTVDFVCCAAGTGTTATGILRGIQNTKLLVFPALKGGEGLEADILKWQKDNSKKDQLRMISTYHFGGYAKISSTLVGFVNDFYRKTKIPLDLIYTGKMMAGLMDLIKQDYFPINSRILFIHSGGLQGNLGFVQKGIHLLSQ